MFALKKLDIMSEIYSKELMFKNYTSREVQLLSEYGVDFEESNPDVLSTPLHAVAAANVNDSHYELAEILLKNEAADANARNSEGETPFSMVVKNGSVKIVQLFLNYKGDVNAMDDAGRTLLEDINDPEVVQLLIDHGLDVNRCNKRGTTALHRACYQSFDYTCRIKVIKCLLKNGANINAIDNEKHTPLTLNVCSYKLYGHKVRKDELNFIMEHTDWGIIPDETLQFYTSDEYFSLDSLWKIILSHLAKLEVLKIPVKPILLGDSLKESSYCAYYKKCKEELLQVKKTKLENSWITYFDLLTGRRKALKNYAGNTDLIMGFKKRDCTKKFPINGFSINENVKKGIRRRTLFDKSSIVLSNCLPIFNSKHLIIRDVLNCILSKKDLSKFCE